MTVGFMLTVLAKTTKKLPAYLFSQWLNSPEFSLRRVMRADNLRDPFRLTHINSPEYRKLWPTAPDYLNTLEHAASGKALLDLMLPNVNEYQECFYRALMELRLGAELEPILKTLSSEWNRITEKSGREVQREEYLKYLARYGAVLPNGFAVATSKASLSK
jgi:multiple sugar transport system substrate-binding protein